MTMNIPAAPAPWRDLILVCRKCSAKLDGRGFGPEADQPLRDVLKQFIRAHQLKGVVRAVEADCLDLCPDGLVSVMRIAFPEEIVPIPPGIAAEKVFERLGFRIENGELLQPSSF